MSLDFSHLVLLFFSLLAIFLTYDAICGEREQGTLRLCWSYSVPRFRLLFGEYGGTLVTLLLPLAVMILLWLIILRLPPSLPMDGADYARLALIAGFTILFVSGFIFLGFWVSALTRSSAASLALLLVIWVGLVVVLSVVFTCARSSEPN
ncbi:MAG TPA: ABC transporter permease subunit [Blastocatellia bacterium]|nr:ABC transporter permease subunit [Blastocatellia bacterium]